MIKPVVYLRNKVKNLCYLSAMLGYKLTSDWIIDHIPEASYLIGDYIKKHPDEHQSLFTKYLRNPEYILEKSESKLKQLSWMDKNGFEPEEISFLKS